MNKLFILLIIGVICAAGLGIVFIKAYDEEMRGVEEIIKHGGDDNDILFRNHQELGNE